jgi:hypothetical protein
MVSHCFHASHPINPFRIRKIPLCPTDYRHICTGLASFMSKLFIGTSESPWNLRVYCYGCAFFTFLLEFVNNLLINEANPVQMSVVSLLQWLPQSTVRLQHATTSFPYLFPLIRNLLYDK